MRIPVISKLRETQNHIKSSEQGSGIHEMGPKIDERDMADWQKIIDWPDADQTTNGLKIVADNTQDKLRAIKARFFTIEIYIRIT